MKQPTRTFSVRHTFPSLLAASLLAAPSLAHSNATEADLRQEANFALGLADSQVVRLSLQGDLERSLSGPLELAGQLTHLALERHSVRADAFQVLEDRGDGVLVAHDPGPVRTVRGSLLGAPDNVVAGALLDDGLHARIRMESGEEWWLQPIARHVPDAGPEHYVLYRADDVLDPERPCGKDLLSNPRPVPIEPGPKVQGAVTLQTAELACDADYEYFLDYGSTGAVQNRIESVVATTNLQYEAEVSITHSITTILVRTSSSQPYTSTDAVTLLNQFRDQWNSSHGGIQRDLAQLFTGKEIQGGTIGIAWLGVVCNLSYGYSVVQSDFNGNFSCATDLSAHEMGHNWNADHCSCTSNTMNPYITCANTFHSSFTIPEIESFRDSRTCLDGDGGGGGGGGDATSVHVASITPSKVNMGQGNKAGRAVVVIEDDLGAPVAGATVTGTFSGDLNETVSGTTGSDGSVTLTTSVTAKGRARFTFCVDDVDASLPYESGDNNETCDSP